MSNHSVCLHLTEGMNAQFVCGNLTEKWMFILVSWSLTEGINECLFVCGNLTKKWMFILVSLTLTERMIVDSACVNLHRQNELKVNASNVFKNEEYVIVKKCRADQMD